MPFDRFHTYIQRIDAGAYSFLGKTVRREDSGHVIRRDTIMMFKESLFDSLDCLQTCWVWPNFLMPNRPPKCMYMPATESLLWRCAFSSSVCVPLSFFLFLFFVLPFRGLLWCNCLMPPWLFSSTSWKTFLWSKCPTLMQIKENIMWQSSASILSSVISKGRQIKVGW